MTTPGLIAGRFDVEACVSEGGMGRLFRARDRASGELVAVKLRQPSASARRFAREASVLAQLGEHPHVVRYVADGEDAVHGAYLAMEWLEGEDLSHRLSRGPLSFAEAWRIGREASAALAHAHAHGFVHRDLKPSNLFLCRESGASRVKLLDFGIVRQREGTPLSQPGATIGSPPYMAPEQVRGERECTPAADVFALGCVLWECVVGRSPFHASHPAGMLAKILYDPSPSLRSELPSAPLALHTLLARMMEKRVDERIADGRQLHAAFARPLPSDLEALEAESSPAPFAARERSPISLLVVGSGLVVDDLTPCFGELTPGMLEPALRATAAAHGGRLDQLPDGSALVFFDADLPAVEQARAAAACALAARELCRPRPLCLLSGRTAPDDPSPISRTVERAAGLLRHGTADCIYVDDLSATLIDAAFECTGVGEGRTLSGPRRGIKRYDSPLVGRRFELSALLLAWEDARQGHARTAVLLGDAGLGKSRLVRELSDAVASSGAMHQLWVGRGDPLRMDSALDFIAGTLAAGLGLDRAGASVPEWLQADAALGELLRLTAPDDAPPHHRQRAAAEAVARCLDRVSQRAPLLLILEDVHWADTASLHVLALALERLAHAPLCVVATARPELAQRVDLALGASAPLTLRLARLDRDESLALVRRALSDAAWDERELSRAAALGEGNPFFLEELAHALRSGRSALPDSVLAVVDARLAQLDDEERAVLASACLYGTSFWEDGVFAVLSSEGVAPLPRAALARLVEAQLVLPHATSRFPGKREFVFRHALLREGALARLTRGDVQRGHLAAAEWLVSAGETDPAVLARHFARGGAKREAAQHTLLASRRARAAGDFALAEALTEAAIGGEPEQSELAALKAELAHVVALRGDYARSTEHVRTLTEVSTEHPHMRLAMAMMAVVVLDDVPDVSALIALWDELLDHAVDPSAASVWCPSFIWGPWEVHSMGRHALVRARLERHRRARERFASAYPAAPLWGVETMVCCELGDVPDPYGTAQRVRAACAQAQELDDVPTRVIVTHALVLAEAFLGLFEEARAHGRELPPAALYASLREVFVAGYTRVLIALGELDEADALLAEYRDRSPPTARTDRGRLLVATAELAEARADHAAADKAYAEATACLRRVPPERAEALLAHARLCGEAHELPRACAMVDEAGQILADLASHGYVGRVPLLLALTRAELAHAQREPDEAASQLRIACRLRDEVASRIHDPVTRTAYLTRRPENLRMAKLAACLRC